MQATGCLFKVRQHFQFKECYTSTLHLASARTANLRVLGVLGVLGVQVCRWRKTLIADSLAIEQTKVETSS